MCCPARGATTHTTSSYRGVAATLQTRRSECIQRCIQTMQSLSLSHVSCRRIMMQAVRPVRMPHVRSATIDPSPDHSQPSMISINCWDQPSTSAAAADSLVMDTSTACPPLPLTITTNRPWSPTHTHTHIHSHACSPATNEKNNPPLSETHQTVGIPRMSQCN
jgi:hypothetical protein